MKKRTIRWIIVLLVLIAIGGFYAYQEFNRTAADLEDEKPVVTTNALKILDEFSKDEHTANQQYLGKILQLSGKIRAIDKDNQGFVTIVLGDESLSSSVRCSMDSTHAKKAAALSTSSPVTIKGICAGYTPDELGLGADLILNRCIVSTK
jgi:hypothetical protein